MKKINISDITLKKLSEEREISLLFREKSAIASCADQLGADTIELAPVKNLREDTIIYKTIAQNIQNATLLVPVGFEKDSVAAAWECINWNWDLCGFTFSTSYNDFRFISIERKNKI